MRKTLIAAAASLLGVLANAPAQQLQPLAPAPDFDKVVVTTTDLGHRIYMLQGEGGNIIVALANDGAIVIDDQFAPLYGKIKASIAALTNQPVRYLVNTHFHRDHRGATKPSPKMAPSSSRTRMSGIGWRMEPVTASPEA